MVADFGAAVAFRAAKFSTRLRTALRYGASKGPNGITQRATSANQALCARKDEFEQLEALRDVDKRLMLKYQRGSHDQSHTQ